MINNNNNNCSFKHKRFYSCAGTLPLTMTQSHLSPSIYSDLPNLSRARKVSTEADIVVSFVKSRQHRCSFEKKFYLKRNSDIVEERICYNTRFDVRNKREFVKSIKLLADLEPSFLEKAVDRGCVNEAPCSSFTRSNLVNVIGNERPLNNNNNNNNNNNKTTPTTTTKEQQYFSLKSVSYDSFCRKYTNSDNSSNQTSSTVLAVNEKVAKLRNLICAARSSSKQEKKIGDLYFEYTSQLDQNVSFYIVMTCYEKSPSKPSSLKSNTKQRLKRELLNCAEEIRKYSTTTAHLSTESCTAGAYEQELNNELYELLELDITNWKVLDYKFKSSKDESFYKQIRRRNRALTEV